MSQRTCREIALDKAEEFIKDCHSEYQATTGSQNLDHVLPFSKSALADLLMEFLDEVSGTSSQYFT